MPPTAPVTRAERLRARHEIIQAANRYTARNRNVAPYTMRHLQRCVCICRRRGLVAGPVLETAGFRTEEAGWPKAVA